MKPAIRAVVLAMWLVACGGGGGKARTAETPAAGKDTKPPFDSPRSLRANGSSIEAAVADATCFADCSERYPGAAQYEGYPAYCGELCTRPSEPSAQCVASCEKSHEPGARYDDRGEYVRDEEMRDGAQILADAEACAAECAKVPVVSDEAMTACVGACTADGRNESACQAECDPDPYDQCRYAPCD